MKYEFVNLYKHCQFKWYLKYGMEVDVRGYKHDDPDYIKELIMNTLEFGIDYATKKYYSRYPIINDKHVEEVIKIEHLINKLNKPNNILEFNYDDVDIVTKNKEDNSYNLYQVLHLKEYKQSDKLSILKYKLENKIKVKDLKILYIPGVELKKYNTESTVKFRNRLLFQLDLYRCIIYDIEYNQKAVDDYLKTVQDIKNNDGSKLDRNIEFHCYSCEYEDICRRSR